MVTLKPTVGALCLSAMLLVCTCCTSPRSRHLTPRTAPLEQPAPLAGQDEVMLIRKSYTVSYNPTRMQPNWVAWHLTGEHTTGEVSRSVRFSEDTSVPAPRASNADYAGSGWSRGHICPAGDNKWDSTAMAETFMLTNICPQHPRLNNGLWNAIELDCRRWARRYGDIYIVGGPVFLRQEHDSIGAHRIPVPEAFFKVVLCLTGKAKAIGFVCLNTGDNIRKDLYVRTVDEVERITGMDFFPTLPDTLERRVEASASLTEW